MPHSENYAYQRANYRAVQVRSEDKDKLLSLSRKCGVKLVDLVHAFAHMPEGSARQLVDMRRELES